MDPKSRDDSPGGDVQDKAPSRRGFLKQGAALFTGAASAVPSRSATSALCATRATTIGPWWRASAHPGRSQVERKRFERLVAEALASVPRRFRDAMTNIAIVVEDEPSSELLDEMEVAPPDTLLGLYQGTPLT